MKLWVQGLQTHLCVASAWLVHTWVNQATNVCFWLYEFERALINAKNQTIDRFPLIRALINAKNLTSRFGCRIQCECMQSVRVWKLFEFSRCQTPYVWNCAGRIRFPKMSWQCQNRRPFDSQLVSPQALWVLQLAVFVQLDYIQVVQVSLKVQTLNSFWNRHNVVEFCKSRQIALKRNFGWVARSGWTINWRGYCIITHAIRCCQGPRVLQRAQPVFLAPIQVHLVCIMPANHLKTLDLIWPQWQIAVIIWTPALNSAAIDSSTCISCAGGTYSSGAGSLVLMLLNYLSTINQILLKFHTV